MTSIAAKLKLTKHHKIERFGIFFITLVLCMGTLTGFIAHSNVTQNSEMLETRSVYTTNISLSLTANKGIVHGVYRSIDRTKGLVLLKFDNPYNISINADDYRAYLTGVKYGVNENISRATLQSRPTGAIITFGSTGYIGVLLHDPNGFPNQIIDMIFRAEKLIVPVDERSRENQEGRDGSFAVYDQCQVFFNPGAVDTVISRALDSNEVNDIMVFNIYNELVSLPAEKDARDALNESLDLMATQLVAIATYEDNLSRLRPYGVVADAVPSYIDGDKVVYDEAIQGNRLVTNQVIAKGFEYDWQSGSVAQGYITDVSQGMRFSDFMRVKRAEVGMRYDASRTQWYQFERDSSGRAINVRLYERGSSIGAGESGVEAGIDRLLRSWTEYASTKTLYQTTQLEALLMLEDSAMDAAQNYTVRSGDTTVGDLTVRTITLY